MTVAGITTDRLYPLALQEELAGCLPGRPAVSVVESFSGHDGFLLEIEQVGRIVRSALRFGRLNRREPSTGLAPSALGLDHR